MPPFDVAAAVPQVQAYLANQDPATQQEDMDAVVNIYRYATPDDASELTRQTLQDLPDPDRRDLFPRMAKGLTGPQLQGVSEGLGEADRLRASLLSNIGQLSSSRVRAGFDSAWREGLNQKPGLARHEAERQTRDDFLSQNRNKSGKAGEVLYNLSMVSAEKEEDGQRGPSPLKLIARPYFTAFYRDRGDQLVNMQPQDEAALTSWVSNTLAYRPADNGSAFSGGKPDDDNTEDIVKEILSAKGSYVVAMPTVYTDTKKGLLQTAQFHVFRPGKAENGEAAMVVARVVDHHSHRYDDLEAFRLNSPYEPHVTAMVWPEVNSGGDPQINSHGQVKLHSGDARLDTSGTAMDYVKAGVIGAGVGAIGAGFAVTAGMEGLLAAGALAVKGSTLVATAGAVATVAATMPSIRDRISRHESFLKPAAAFEVAAVGLMGVGAVTSGALAGASLMADKAAKVPGLLVNMVKTGGGPVGRFLYQKSVSTGLMAAGVGMLGWQAKNTWDTCSDESVGECMSAVGSLALTAFQAGMNYKISSQGAKNYQAANPPGGSPPGDPHEHLPLKLLDDPHEALGPHHDPDMEPTTPHSRGPQDDPSSDPGSAGDSGGAPRQSDSAGGSSPKPKPEPKSELKPEPKPEAKPEAKPEPKPQPKPVDDADEDDFLTWFAANHREGTSSDKGRESLPGPESEKPPGSGAASVALVGGAGSTLATAAAEPSSPNVVDRRLADVDSQLAMLTQPSSAAQTSQTETTSPGPKKTNGHSKHTTAQLAGLEAQPAAKPATSAAHGAENGAAAHTAPVAKAAASVTNGKAVVDPQAIAAKPSSDVTPTALANLTPASVATSTAAVATPTATAPATASILQLTPKKQGLIWATALTTLGVLGWGVHALADVTLHHWVDPAKLAFGCYLARGSAITLRSSVARTLGWRVGRLGQSLKDFQGAHKLVLEGATPEERHTGLGRMLNSQLRVDRQLRSIDRWGATGLRAKIFGVSPADRKINEAAIGDLRASMRIARVGAEGRIERNEGPADDLSSLVNFDAALAKLKPMADQNPKVWSLNSGAGMTHDGGQVGSLAYNLSNTVMDWWKHGISVGHVAGWMSSAFFLPNLGNALRYTSTRLVDIYGRVNHLSPLDRGKLVAAFQGTKPIKILGPAVFLGWSAATASLIATDLTRGLLQPDLYPPARVALSIGLDLMFAIGAGMSSNVEFAKNAGAVLKPLQTFVPLFTLGVGIAGRTAIPFISPVAGRPLTLSIRTNPLSVTAKETSENEKKEKKNDKEIEAKKH